MDSLPKSHAYEVILVVVVEKLTNYVHFIHLSHPYTTTKVASVFMKEIFKFHGMPQSIISDRDAIFISKRFSSCIYAGSSS